MAAIVQLDWQAATCLLGHAQGWRFWDLMRAAVSGHFFRVKTLDLPVGVPYMVPSFKGGSVNFSHPFVGFSWHPETKEGAGMLWCDIMTKWYCVQCRLIWYDTSLSWHVMTWCCDMISNMLDIIMFHHCLHHRFGWNSTWHYMVCPEWVH